MITDNQLKLVGMQLNILHDCIRSTIYFRNIASHRNKETAWIYIKYVMSDHLIQSWCKIFGSTREDTHWKELAESKEVISIIELYSESHILHATSLTDTEWHEYHKNMLIARNQFFAHFDMESMILNYPNLEPALKSAISYCEWLSSLLDNVGKLAIKDGTVIVNKAPSTTDMLKTFNEEVSAIRS
jgi:hypothetical protein